MIFNMVYGAAAGGVSFNVVTAQQLPAVVVDHQVVVLTGTEPGTICFSYAAPAEPVSGDIWIHTVDNGGYSLSIAGDQSIFLTPGLTMQYNGSTWVYCNAYIGVAGVWQLFSTNSPFSALTWEQIISICNSGELITNFNGFTLKAAKNVTFGSETVAVELCGVRTDARTDGGGTGGKAAATFFMKQCFSASAQMNASSTNEGGWGASRMRSTTVPSYLNLMPAELKATNGIKAVNKVNNKGANPTSDRLWPGSEYEILGVTSYSGAQEGVKYTRSSNVFMQNGSACIVWLRSAFASYSNYFCVVSTSGGASYGNADYSGGVALGFCI